MSDTPRTDEAESIHYTEEDYFGEDTTKEAYDFARELERENAELRRDKERLDWILSEIVCAYYPTWHPDDMKYVITRDDIDEAINKTWN